MDHRRALIGTTALAVVSDSMLAPFYPELFVRSFHVDEPRFVGVYLAATCLVAMVGFPIWAIVERRIETLRLLVVTQAIAGLLSVGCAFVTDAWSFVALSLTMVAFKSSYLLVYPYLLRHESTRDHAATIGVLSVIVHLGAILGSSIGGALLEVAPPSSAFLVMAVGDFVQMIACLVATRPAAIPESGVAPRAATPVDRRTRLVALAKLATVMLLFYGASFIGRPFFAEHWYASAGTRREWISGLVYSIPGWISLASLLLERRSGRPTRPSDWVPWTAAVGAIGLAMQASTSVPAIVIGRIAFGWSLFHAMVCLDVLAFEQSSREDYAIDFSRISLFQQLGVLLAWASAGHLVARFGLASPLLVGAVAFVAFGLVQLAWFGRGTAPAPTDTAATDDSYEAVVR